MSYNFKICPNCRWTVLIHLHPTMHGWVKCEICSYAEKIKKPS